MEIKRPVDSALGILIHITPEEQLWIDRINRHHLWLKYAPSHIIASWEVEVMTADSFLPDKWPMLFGKQKYIDKRTRNEIGQEKHESRKCKECGR